MCWCDSCVMIADLRDMVILRLRYTCITSCLKHIGETYVYRDDIRKCKYTNAANFNLPYSRMISFRATQL